MIHYLDQMPHSTVVRNPPLYLVGQETDYSKLCFIVFLSSPANFWDNTPKVDYDCLLPYPSLFTIYKHIVITL
jgi:hypothetical protein